MSTLWFDEAGQFFISKGLNHWSDPYAPYGQLSDVVANNAHYNMDPGGYGIILHYWSMISDNSVWLRTLSFLFFVAAGIFTALTCKLITTDNKISVASGLLIFALYCGTQPFELRAYSMELCGVAYGLYIMYWLRDKNRVVTFFYASIALAFFLTSRYTMIVFAFIYSCFILFDVLKSERCTRLKLRIFIAYCVPLVITVTTIIILAMRVQNSSAAPLSYIDYLNTKPILLAVLALSAAIILSYKIQPAPTRRIICVYVSINLIFASLGVAHKLPWVFSCNKGGPFLLLLLLTLYTCGFMLMRKYSRQRIIHLAYLGSVIFISLFFSFMYGSGPLSPTTYPEIDKIITQTPEIHNAPIIYVSHRSTPVIRYLYEKGALADKAETHNYVKRYRLLKSGPHCQNQATLEKNRLTLQRNLTIVENAPIGSIYLTSFHCPESIPNGYTPIKQFIYIKSK